MPYVHLVHLSARIHNTPKLIGDINAGSILFPRREKMQASNLKWALRTYNPSKCTRLRVGNLYNCEHDPLLNACMTVPYHRGPMGVWPRIFVSLVQVSLVQYGNTLSARGCESNFGFQNAQWVEEHTWKRVTERRNDWSLLNFADLGHVPPKKNSSWFLRMQSPKWNPC